MCGSLAFFNSMSGVNIINIYAMEIFETINKHIDNPPSLSPTQDTYVIGTAGFLGAILANFIVNIKIKRIFVGGHLFMGIFLISSGIAIHFN